MNKLFVVCLICLFVGADVWVGIHWHNRCLEAARRVMEKMEREMVARVNVVTNRIPVALSYTNDISTSTIRWQMDDQRENNRLAALEEKGAAEFWITNKFHSPTNALYWYQITHYYHPIHVSTNDVELGFRSDGAVLWRIPPEAQ